MVELRKRPAPPPSAAPPSKKKSTAKPKAKKEVSPAAPTKMENGTSAPPVGSTITLAGFGGEVQTHDETKVTLAKLVEDSKAGVVLFTYPKASTPGWFIEQGTTQACLFRDAYAPLTATGLSIYGLSNDSPKANTSFKTKQELPYPLLCDPEQTLIGAIGLKKEGNKTTRGVFVVDKQGKVLASEPGGPAPTVEVVKQVVAKMGGSSDADGLGKAEERAKGEGEKAGDKRSAEVAADVADEADKARLDRSKASTPVVS
ncbi:thioredoxin peroxidase dot5 [Saxophila tyrrhenica]|uniref:thioredoxin-dependent peroxiredoxin n=1 Tax=Saxophila tyrrhenica TaxID=1690608 RepID=A0AAV9PDX2_9PEZI|nr:thioredoxin peroxidase dot5 [Saxophila tyrrhenica]